MSRLEELAAPYYLFKDAGEASAGACIAVLHAASARFARTTVCSVVILQRRRVMVVIA